MKFFGKVPLPFIIIAIAATLYGLASEQWANQREFFLKKMKNLFRINTAPSMQSYFAALPPPNFKPILELRPADQHLKRSYAALLDKINTFSNN